MMVSGNVSSCAYFPFTWRVDYLPYLVANFSPHHLCSINHYLALDLQFTYPPSSSPRKFADEEIIFLFPLVFFPSSVSSLVSSSFSAIVLPTPDPSYF